MNNSNRIKKIHEAILIVKKAEHSKELHKNLSQIRNEKIRRLNELKERLMETNWSITQLSKKSFYFIYMLLQGKKEKELEILKHNHLAISLEYKETIQSLKNLDDQISNLKSEINLVPILKENLKDIFIETKKEFSEFSFENYRQCIKKLDDQIGLANELEEAVKEGVKLNSKLGETIRYSQKLEMTYKSGLLPINNLTPKTVKQIELFQRRI